MGQSGVAGFLGQNPIFIPDLALTSLSVLPLLQDSNINKQTFPNRLESINAFLVVVVKYTIYLVQEVQWTHRLLLLHIYKNKIQLNKLSSGIL